MQTDHYLLNIGTDRQGINIEYLPQIMNADKEYTSVKFYAKSITNSLSYSFPSSFVVNKVKKLSF